ncbi:MAG: hypothetical protein V1776_01895 [Candidatus Diapherotrites archaeon]
MIPISQLQFARKYPFSSSAKQTIRHLSPNLEDVDSSLFSSAGEWILALGSASSKNRRAFVEHHFAQREISYSEFLTRDILVFPLIKVLLSCMGNPVLYERFAMLMGDLTFEYLASEKDRSSAIIELAHELGYRIEFSHMEDKPVFHISLSQYLAFPLKDAQLHLVNQPVHKGVIRADVNTTARWLAEGVHAIVRESLPVEVKGLPSSILSAAAAIRENLNVLRSQESRSLPHGVILDAFPPCMEKLHGEIISGGNIPHMARFDLATFLINIHMPLDDIMSVFSKASNFDEHVTRYHVENLSGKSSGKKYSVPACSKIREHGLCVSRTCNVGHPLQFYERESVFEKDKKEENDSVGKNPIVPTATRS